MVGIQPIYGNIGDEPNMFQTTNQNMEIIPVNHPRLRHQRIGQDVEAPGCGGKESHGSQSRTSLVCRDFSGILRENLENSWRNQTNPMANVMFEFV